MPGFQPQHFVEDGRLYGLGISNMKGALACYVEAVRALQDAGVRLRGDVMIAAVCGEIEKTQYGDAQGPQYRGYAAGSRYLVSHGGVADMCLLGEPTEGKVVLGHFGALWLRIRVHGNFIHTAFSEGKRDQNAILRMHEVLAAVRDWIPTLGGRPRERLPRREGDRQRRRDRGWLRLAGLAHAASRGPLPRRARAADEADGRRAARGARDGARLAERFPAYGVEGEVYVTAPGAEIDEDHELVAAIDAAHEEVFGAAPERDVTRWFSDASALTRYGIPTVNYGTSTGLMDVERGENLEIDGLVRTAEVSPAGARASLRLRSGAVAEARVLASYAACAQRLQIRSNPSPTVSMRAVDAWIGEHRRRRRSLSLTPPVRRALALSTVPPRRTLSATITPCGASLGSTASK